MEFDCCLKGSGHAVSEDECNLAANRGGCLFSICTFGWAGLALRGI
jgi:hypothetical protein